ncbi:uncharacterized protein LOC124536630 isoform X2 [Vanessa cardui]|uniref:uncharacterized protein LOC124536630 isoform X2 n=1 Tax=Vanessa cardui TaxID=171605 RepID=UPI001F13A012|nr:uncharacterized protein LOC124536630 isoform X2 [Vanessa cardui]
MERATITFAVVPGFFGRRLFNKLTVVTVPPESSQDKAANTSMQTYEQSASTNLRLQEEQSKQVPDSRTQFIDQRLYSASREENVTELEPIHTKKLTHQSDVNNREAPRLSTAITNYSRNPFDDTYDESKNPFADDEINDPTNPFAEDDDDDDYDKNLNPFS